MKKKGGQRAHRKNDLVGGVGCENSGGMKRRSDEEGRWRNVRECDLERDSSRDYEGGRSLLFAVDKKVAERMTRWKLEEHLNNSKGKKGMERQGDRQGRWRKGEGEMREEGEREREREDITFSITARSFLYWAFHCDSNTETV